VEADGITSWPRMTGPAKAAGAALYIDGRRQELTVLKDSLQGSTRTSVPLELVASIPTRNPLRQSAFRDFRFYLRNFHKKTERLPVEDYVAELVQNAPGLVRR